MIGYIDNRVTLYAKLFKSYFLQGFGYDCLEYNFGFTFKLTVKLNYKADNICFSEYIVMYKWLGILGLDHKLVLTNLYGTQSKQIIVNKSNEYIASHKL